MTKSKHDKATHKPAKARVFPVKQARWLDEKGFMMDLNGKG